MVTLPKLVSKSNQSQSRASCFCREIHRPIRKLSWKYKGCVIAKIILKKKNFRIHTIKQSRVRNSPTHKRPINSQQLTEVIMWGKNSLFNKQH